MKKRRKPYRPTRRSWLDIQLVIASASTESQDEDVHRWLATEAYAGLEKLVSGLFTMRDFAAMSKLCTFGHMLITEIYPSLDHESRAVMDGNKTKMEDGAEALYSIAERYERTGKFGASGPDLQTLREAFSLMDTITGYATRGESVRAMMRADELTQTIFAKRRKAA